MQKFSAQTLKKGVPTFEYEAYINSQNKKQYLQDLIQVVLHKKKITTPILCMNQLNDIIIQLKIPLKTQQIHQLYLYSTFQRYQKPSDAKKRIMAIVNQSKNKVDVLSASEWLNQKIQAKQINFVKMRQKKSASEHFQFKQKKQKQRLPPLRGTYGQKLQQQLKGLIQIFQEMEKQRQNSGLIPINDQNEEDQVQVPSTNIPYDPELYQLNNNLAKLRIRAQDRLSRIIELAKTDNRIREKLEQAIEKFQKARIQANQKVGRMGAMKAHKRLMQKKKQQYKKFKNLKLGEDQNIVHASHLYSLLSLPQIKQTKIIY